MLRVTIELVPHGIGAPKKLGVINIANDGTGNQHHGNYRATSGSKKGYVYVRRWPRWRGFPGLLGLVAILLDKQRHGTIPEVIFEDEFAHAIKRRYSSRGPRGKVILASTRHINPANCSPQVRGRVERTRQRIQGAAEVHHAQHAGAAEPVGSAPGSGASSSGSGVA